MNCCQGTFVVGGFQVGITDRMKVIKLRQHHTDRYYIYFPKTDLPYTISREKGGKHITALQTEGGGGWVGIVVGGGKYDRVLSFLTQPRCYVPKICNNWIKYFIPYSSVIYFFETVILVKIPPHITLSRAMTQCEIHSVTNWCHRMTRIFDYDTIIN